MIISIIAAVAKNGVIGSNNGLPWHLPADFAHFKELTMDKPVIMGQKTFESIGKALPGRINIVLSRNEDFHPENCLVVKSIEDSLEAAKGHGEAMIAGGVSIYSQFLPLANRMYLTEIEEEFQGDAFFPEYNKEEWQEVKRLEQKPDKDNPHQYSFVTYERK